MSQIYSIIPAAYRPALNAFFEAYKYGPGTYDVPLTTDNPANYESPWTHYHSYDASAAPTAFSLYSQAKVGVLPPNDKNGDPIPYGIGGVVSAADTLEAFAHLELWANDSSEEPYVFAVGRRAAVGLNLVPFEM